MKKIYIILVGLLVVIYLFLRLDKFELKTTYHLDQGLHLLESFEMVKSKKIRLIGPMVSSKTFMDRGFFIGPQYYYVLAGLGMLTGWNPIRISIVLLLMELAFVLYFVYWLYRKYGPVESLMVLALITFSKYLIIHSRFFWNPHFLIPLSILAVISLDKYLQTKKIYYLAVVGFLWGLSFSFHYSAALWVIPLFLVLLKNDRLWKWENLVIVLFFLIGDLPWFLFEFRHNFYNIKTLIWVGLNSSTSGKMELHYFIQPLMVFLLVGLVSLFSKIKKYKIVLAVGVVLSVSCLQILLIHDYIPLGYPIGWTYPLQKKVVAKILENGCPENYNVASTVSGDTRSYDIRFLLIAHGCPPLGVEDYPITKKLFLVAPASRPAREETVWEVSSLGKFKNIKKKN